MAWQFPQSETGAGLIVDLGTTDDAFVASGVYLASTNSVTISGTGSNHEVVVEGIVANGNGPDTILLGLDGSASSNNSVTIAEGGEVRQFSTAFAIAIGAHSSSVTNAGLISAALGGGIVMSGNNPAATSTAINSGTITAVLGVQHIGADTFVFENSGFLSGSILAFDGGDAIDRITNTGRIVGNIDLNLGNDVYNGAAGRLNGEVSGSDGNDRIAGGIDNDLFYGGNQNDILTGNSGNDRLYGDAHNDKLHGGAGNDRLYGGSQNDRLDGGAGNDRLYGGIGNDKMYGGAGTDRAYFDGNKGAYTIATKGNKTTVKGPDGTDQLVGVEFLVFDNGTVVL